MKSCYGWGQHSTRSCSNGSQQEEGESLWTEELPCVWVKGFSIPSSGHFAVLGTQLAFLLCSSVRGSPSCLTALPGRGRIGWRASRGWGVGGRERPEPWSPNKVGSAPCPQRASSRQFTLRSRGRRFPQHCHIGKKRPAPLRSPLRFRFKERAGGVHSHPPRAECGIVSSWPPSLLWDGLTNRQMHEHPFSG